MDDHSAGKSHWPCDLTWKFGGGGAARDALQSGFPHPFLRAQFL